MTMVSRRGFEARVSIQSLVRLGLGLLFGLAGRFVLLCSIGIRLGAVVGFVETSAFEDDAATRSEESFDRSLAVLDGTIGELLIAHLLKDLEGVAAGLAAIVVIGHMNFLVVVEREVA